MTAPNRNVLWARAIVDELVGSGVSAAVVSPGSRSTPLTMALAENDDVRIFSQLDERSAAYFALGRARRTGEVTPLVCTSGTAAANYHPAVKEADEGRVPLLALTADRPPELRDSGANQTTDQEKLYGDAVRWYRDLPEPEPEARKLRSLRTDIARAVASAEGSPAGPVHLNVGFAKPLAPVQVDGDVPDDLDPEAASGRDGAFVRTTTGSPDLDEATVRQVADRLDVDRGLLVVGPTTAGELDPKSIVALAHGTGFPILADPLSGLRFGGQTRVAPVIGGYDGFLTEALAEEWPDPDAILRVGASPTSKALRTYLARVDADQILVDPAGGWREAGFTATDLVVADPSRLAGAIQRVLMTTGSDTWRDRWETAEATHWEAVADEETFFEGHILADVVDLAPDPTTLFVSNSMPVRDLDRFGRPQAAAITALGNRGVSGIDGVVSTALGAGSGTTDHLTLVAGDLAYYHDMNGLLALERCDVEATIVLVNNDGGGIFHKLPVEAFDPPFTEQFKTPHGLDFAPTADIYGFDYARVDDREGFRAAYEEAVASDGSHVVEVVVDAEESHRVREALKDRVVDHLV